MEIILLANVKCDTTLNYSAGKTSFEDMLTVNEHAYDNYKDVCYALGLVNDDGE